MDELITWLRVQLDDDERVARESKGAFWYTDGHSRQALAFMERFDEDRVLAEVEAKRRILDEIVDEANGIDLSVDMDRRVGIRDETVEPCLGDRLVRLLAQPYAGREGWREEWRA